MQTITYTELDTALAAEDEADNLDALGNEELVAHCYEAGGLSARELVLLDRLQRTTEALN